MSTLNLVNIIFSLLCLTDVNSKLVVLVDVIGLSLLKEYSNPIHVTSEKVFNYPLENPFSLPSYSSGATGLSKGVCISDSIGLKITHRTQSWIKRLNFKVEPLCYKKQQSIPF